MLYVELIIYIALFFKMEGPKNLKKFRTTSKFVTRITKIKCDKKTKDIGL